MSHQDVTFIFRDGQTYAIHQGKVIAASDDSDLVQRQVRQAFGPDPSMGLNGGSQEPNNLDVGRPGTFGDTGELPTLGDLGGCPGCGAPDAGGNFCPECGQPVGHAGGQEDPGLHPEHMDAMSAGDEDPYGEMGYGRQAKVITPNGLKGSVLGKVSGLWGDEVTVRLENGRIVKLPTGTELRTQKAAATQSNPIERLEARLAATPDGTRDSLVARSDELVTLRRTAAVLIREGVSWADAKRLDEIVVTADVERHEVADALAHLDDVEAIVPPELPTFSIAAAKEAAGISREDASWLDASLTELVKEAEAQDFTRLMDEGPEAFAAELPDSALADTGTTRQMASNFVGAKTAGIAREIADPYIDTFLARVEECRRAELSTRKQTTHKEAAAAEDDFGDFPDDCLFLS